MAQLADVVAAGIRTGRGGMALTVLEGLTVLVDGALLQAMAEAPGARAVPVRGRVDLDLGRRVSASGGVRRRRDRALA